MNQLSDHPFTLCGENNILIRHNYPEYTESSEQTYQERTIRKILWEIFGEQSQ